MFFYFSVAEVINLMKQLSIAIYKSRPFPFSSSLCFRPGQHLFENFAFVVVYCRSVGKYEEAAVSDMKIIRKSLNRDCSHHCSFISFVSSSYIGDAVI